MSGYFKKQQCCASGWHLWQKCSFHRKMSELLIANHLAASLFSNFIQKQQISNRNNRKNKINPKHVIAYQTAVLLGKNFQWKYGFVWELFRWQACFSAQSFTCWKITSLLSIQHKYYYRAMSVGSGYCIVK